ncbi:MAG: hypothetical protein ACXVIQ_00160 [Ilumatobacteraceae bacterium]
MCDFTTIQSWNQRGVAPAYMRGMPAGVRRSALRRLRSRRKVT